MGLFPLSSLCRASPVVQPLAEHGAPGADLGAADAGVRGGGGAEDRRVHAARLLAEQAQPLRPAGHRGRLHLDIHALHTQGDQN